MTDNCQCININTISGGIVNFGGAIKIAPISITKSTSSGTTSEATSPATLVKAAALEALGSMKPS